MGARVYGLCCRGEEFPVNIIDGIYFSWKLRDCKKQLGYSLKVFDETGKTVFFKEEETKRQRAFIGDLPLSDLALYRYEVAVKTDAYTDSASGFFRAGLQGGFGDEALWISDGRKVVVGDKDARGVYLKKVFFAAKTPNFAVAHVCGLGLYELYINSKKVGDRVLEPAFTDYGKRVLYSSYDVAPYIKQGENVIEVLLANGWYNQTTADTWKYWQAQWRDAPKLLFRLDTDTERIVSDLSWAYSYGQLVSSALRTGEFYDFTATSAEWQPVSIVAAPKGKVYPSYLPPIRETQTLAPVSITKKDGCTVFDFGQNITGYCRVELIGKRGEKVYVEHAEKLAKDGLLDNSALKIYIKEDVRYQTDGCVLSGAVDVLKPRFVYHGFRYVAVHGDAEIKDIKAIYARTDLPEVGTMRLSAEIPNALYQMTLQSIKGNFHGLPTDCPHREKNGWLGDAQVSIEPALYNFEMLEAYRKFLNDILDNQSPSGQFSEFVPAPYEEAFRGCWPVWEITFYRIPQALLHWYGDIDTVKKFYPHLKRHFAFVYNTYCENEIVEYGLGDHCFPKNASMDVCPNELLSALYYMRMAEILTEFSALCAPEDGEFYRKRVSATKKAIIDKYAKNTHSLPGLAALTEFGVVDCTKEVIAYSEKHGYAAHFGIIGAKLVLDVLGVAGRQDIILKYLENTEYPSFGYWVVNGQTTLCETFEMEDSRNHHMFSGIAESMVKHFAGVMFGEEMKSIEISPVLPVGLNEIYYSREMGNGEFSILMKREVGRTCVKIALPPNVEVVFKDRVLETGEYEMFV